MSQLTVTRFYNTRKRDRVNKDVKLLKELSVSTDKTSEIKSNLEKTETAEYDKCENDSLKSIGIDKNLKSKKNIQSKTSKVTKTTKKKNIVQTTVTNFYPSQAVKSVNEKQKELSEKTLPSKTKAKPKKDVLINNTKSVLVTKQDKESIDLKKSDSSNSIVLGYEVSNHEALKDNQVFHSPKRNLSGAGEGSPLKKPALALNREISNSDGISSSNNTPSKSKESPVKKQLQFDFSPSKLQKISSPNAKGQQGSPRKILSESEKLDALINNSRSKILFSSNLENLKKSLASFSEKTSKLKEFQSNPCKISSVVSAPNNTEKSALPSRPAHEQFKYLAEPETSSLLLPFKYKLLSEMFRSMDTVISILNNRKEKITFEKVRDGVQKMTKRNFTKTYLGQIVTVFPSAYTLTLERGNKKTDGAECQLIIYPNLATDKGNKPSKSNTYICMQPQCLIDRRNEFHNSILKIVKQHHQMGRTYLLKNSSGRSPLTDGKMPCLLRYDWSKPIDAESGRGKGLGRSENKRPEARRS
ncbi:DNA replication factor Cdt1 [Trichonephila clavipes]|nr:DNA replication factor Cdt1 [Trichonephila clavipes]